MGIKFIQVDCKEEINTKNWRSPDYRQAEVVLKHKPDIIIFEKANNGKTPNTIYNRYSCKNKPIQLVRKHQKWLKEKSKEYGDAASGISMWDNIIKLWSEDHKINYRVSYVANSVVDFVVCCWYDEATIFVN